MIRKLLITGVAILSAIPVFANTTKFETGQLATTPEKPVALRLMNDQEFSTFLTRLDSDLLHSQLRMKKMDVKSLSLDLQEKQELERSYSRCLQSLDPHPRRNPKASLAEANAQTRFISFDRLERTRSQSGCAGRDFNESHGCQRNEWIPEVPGYAREVLGIDGALATQISAFQHHFIAFTGVIDATLDQPEPADSQPPMQK